MLNVEKLEFVDVCQSGNEKDVVYIERRFSSIHREEDHRGFCIYHHITDTARVEDLAGWNDMSIMTG